MKKAIRVASASWAVGEWTTGANHTITWCYLLWSCDGCVINAHPWSWWVGITSVSSTLTAFFEPLFAYTYNTRDRWEQLLLRCVPSPLLFVIIACVCVCVPLYVLFVSLSVLLCPVLCAFPSTSSVLICRSFSSNLLLLPLVLVSLLVGLLLVWNFRDYCYTCSSLWMWYLMIWSFPDIYASLSLICSIAELSLLLLLSFLVFYLALFACVASPWLLNLVCVSACACVCVCVASLCYLHCRVLSACVRVGCRSCRVLSIAVCVVCVPAFWVVDECTIGMYHTITWCCPLLVLLVGVWSMHTHGVDDVASLQCLWHPQHSRSSFCIQTQHPW